MKREIIRLIRKMFGDTSQTMAKTKEDLEEVRDLAQELIDNLE